MPCDEKWRTPAGIDLGGPRHFGYDIDYVPVEQRFSGGVQPAGGRRIAPR